jgi:uncharacterized protein (DUF697 family)
MPRSKKSTIQNNPLEKISHIGDVETLQNPVSPKKLSTPKKSANKKSPTVTKKAPSSNKRARQGNESAKPSAMAQPIIQSPEAKVIQRDIYALSTIKKWSRVASACAIPPVPLLATAASSSVQIKMIKDLCTIYEVPFHKELVKATVSSILGSGTALFSLGYLAKELLHKIPYAGNALLILTQPAAIYKLTSGLGAIFMRHFQNQGDLTNLDLAKSRLLLKNQLQ